MESWLVDLDDTAMISTLIDVDVTWLIGKANWKRKTLNLKRGFDGLSEQSHMNKSELKSHLYECLHIEAMRRNKPFSWWRTLQFAINHSERRYVLSWRVASYLYHSYNKFWIKLAKEINRNLISRHGTEVELGAHIDAGITFIHHQGIVI